MKNPHASRLPQIFCIFLGILFLNHVAAAQSLPTAAAQAARIDRHYNALRSLSVHFTQKFEGMGVHREESGILLLKKPGKMRWTYAKPAGKLFVLDGHDAYFYSPGDTDIPRVPAKKLDDLRSPLRFLLGHTQLARELTNIQIAPADNGAYTLSGIPKNMENRISAFSITASAEGVIQSMHIEQSDGSINTFLFSSEQPNVPAPDSAFVFHSPAGTRIIDGTPPV